MKAEEAYSQMVYPGMPRNGKPLYGVIQVHVTRACDLACFNCTQGSNLSGKPRFISLENFEAAMASLKDYFGVVGLFGGNPALHPEFYQLCKIMQKYIPYHRRGLWCNHPRGNGRIMAETFNPGVSNLNVHLVQEAWDEFLRDWPALRGMRNLFGRTEDSRHAPVFVAMKDVIEDEGLRWDLIANCDINKHWSAMVGEFRGELRGWFCEIAGAQAILHQDDPDYPDTGIPIDKDGLTYLQTPNAEMVKHPWWRLPGRVFEEQVNYHCHRCGVPLKGKGTNAQAPDLQGKEFVSIEHLANYKPKRKEREVVVSTKLEDIEPQHHQFTHYLQNANKD